MSTSGTATFNMDLAEIVEECFEKCGTELRSGYDLRTARRSLNTMFASWANRGINMWTIDSAEITLIPDQRDYALPTDTVDLMDAVIRTGTGVNQQDISMQRITVSVYSSIPNKTSTGYPLQMVVNRTLTPTVTLWPIPDSSQDYRFVYWRLRRIQDAGTGANTQDIPFRFLPPLTAGLAYYLGTKLPTVTMERLAMLKAQYDESWEEAAFEDRDKSPLRLVPRWNSMR